MYSLILLLSLVVAGAFVRAFVLGRRRWAPVFSVSLAAALYTHNWALFLTLAALAALGWCVWSQPAPERRRLARDGALAFAGAAVLYLPWVPTLLYQATHTGAPWAAAAHALVDDPGNVRAHREPGGGPRAAAWSGATGCWPVIVRAADGC